MTDGYTVLILMHAGGPEEIGLLAVEEEDKQWMVRGFTTEEAALEYFEGGYRNCHQRSYESSMSATINWLTFQPSIIHLSEDKLAELVSQKVVKRARNVAGSMDYIPLKLELAKPLWESGRKPTLIKDEWLPERSYVR